MNILSKALSQPFTEWLTIYIAPTILIALAIIPAVIINLNLGG